MEDKNSIRPIFLNSNGARLYCVDFGSEGPPVLLLRGLAGRGNEWKHISCPTLVIGGANSFIPRDELQEMARSLPDGRYIQIPNAGHDLHLEQPEAWRQAAKPFLRALKVSHPMP
ncbi:MAG TPA: alpha/beta hydrolase [Ktedonobacteraceae bacterium]|nr:alpha/beta hydrolase [Ktedonobacteraceae bacterium]